MKTFLLCLFSCFIACQGINIYLYVDNTTLTLNTTYQNYVKNSVVFSAARYWNQTLLNANLSAASSFILPHNVNCSNYTVLAGTFNEDYAHFFYYYNATDGHRALTENCYFLDPAVAKNRRSVISVTKINVNYILLPNGDYSIHKRNLNAIVHEMAHGLGFTNDAAAYWYNNSTQTTYDPGYFTNFTNPINNLESWAITIPTLAARVQQYFGCSNVSVLPGLLGDYPGNSHWFDRYFWEEMIQPVVDYFDQGVSPLTLAVLETTGWWTANYSRAENYNWGKGQGCDFISLSGTSVSQKFPEFHVNKTSQRTCTHSRSSAGGAFTYYLENYTDNITYTPGNWNYACENANVNSSNFWAFELQSFGSVKSKCFDGNLIAQTSTASSTFSTYCFQYTCNSNGTLSIIANNGTVLGNCVEGGSGSVSVSGYNGFIVCPDVTNFCSQIDTNLCPKDCIRPDYGTCNDGVCKCNLGYDGPDCSLLQGSEGFIHSIAENQELSTVDDPRRGDDTISVKFLGISD